jgi:hypothetical protein
MRGVLSLLHGARLLHPGPAPLGSSMLNSNLTHPAVCHPQMCTRMMWGKAWMRCCPWPPWPMPAAAARQTARRRRRAGGGRGPPRPTAPSLAVGPSTSGLGEGARQHGAGEWGHFCWYWVQHSCLCETVYTTGFAYMFGGGSVHQPQACACHQLQYMAGVCHQHSSWPNSSCTQC